MAKYINADALREIWVWGKNDKYGYSECIPLKDLDDFPAADVVEVVRCKDCNNNPNESWFGCPAAHLSERQRPEDAWCWKGARKNG